MRPQLLQELWDMPREELREVIAHAAGIHAYHDGDGGRQLGEALERIRTALADNARKGAQA